VALEEYLVPAFFTATDWQNIKSEAEQIVFAARDTALDDPKPVPDSVTKFVFSDPATPQQVGGLINAGISLPPTTTTPTPPDRRRHNFVEAIRLAMQSELARNPLALVFGEDVGEKGGVHAATLGLQKDFGSNRVFDTSLSEEGIIGRAVGMAIGGLLPIPEIQFRKYADPATEQLHNCGTIRWRTNNNFAAPIVVRIPGGYRKIGDPWHSVTNEIEFAHSVGWKVAFPSNAEDGVGLLRAALRGNDPVIFFEHRAVLDSSWGRRPYPGDNFVLPFGKGNKITEGDDLTIVTWGAMVERCEEAVKQVKRNRENSQKSIGFDLIDLRTIQPWDKEMVLESVRKTSKCLVVHEDIEFGGFGGEIIATIISEGFMDLDAPVERLAAPQVPVPFDTGLMNAMIPTPDQIQAKIEWLLDF
jgi:2-oxoisovalerate dehydrogenase E1 component